MTTKNTKVSPRIEKRRNELIGMKRLNTQGHEMTIIDYRGMHDITIKFDTGNTLDCQYGNFLKGHVRNPFSRTIEGVGYLGEIDKLDISKDVYSKAYLVWRHMLRLCYSERSILIIKTEWHNFSNFARWYVENYYEVNGEKSVLSKDILDPKSKEFSPETCIFVPGFIFKVIKNTCRKSRGDLPIGVIKHKGNYDARLSYFGASRHVGSYSTPQAAFNAYKKAKEDYVKELADLYKGSIPERLYDALYEYEVDCER